MEPPPLPPPSRAEPRIRPEEKGEEKEEEQERGTFLISHPERAELNQYWYSTATTAVLVAEIQAEVAAVDAAEDGTQEGLAVAFLSTPSLYFSVSPAVRARSRLLDLDEQWSTDPNFVLFDFREGPHAIPAALHGQFAMVCIDPPFITSEVWTKYAEAARVLLRPQGRPRILATSVAERADTLLELLNVHEQRFKPCIPNLVYQYSLFVNWESRRLAVPNPEVLED